MRLSRPEHQRNFHPVSSRYEEKDLFGELETKDLEWTCPGNFATETQTFYTLGDDGTSLMCQVIHSAVGVWYPTVQFTCRIYNAQKNISEWRSINVSNFTVVPTDKRSSKADQYSITHKSKPGTDYPESYIISANLGTDVQISLEVHRPVDIPAWKLGKGPKGGFSYFGPDLEKPEAYVVHRFWPRTKVIGLIVLNGHANPIQGPGMYIHAIQGMRPNLVAQSWNFANFQSDEHGGCSALQMEFITQSTHGKKGNGSGGVSVSVGSIVVGGKLVSVTAETKWPGEASEGTLVSRATHLNGVHDPDTGYNMPKEILFEWSGPSIVPNASGTVKASVKGEYGDLENPKGLIQKVDFLAEIPYAIKMVVNYVAQTKPYMYQATCLRLDDGTQADRPPCLSLAPLNAATVVTVSYTKPPSTKFSSFPFDIKKRGCAAHIDWHIQVQQSSAALEAVRTAARIALTFIPVILIKNHKSRYWLKKAEVHGIPTSEEKKAKLLHYIRKRTLLLHFLFFVPVVAFWVTIIASLERTPITGRIRLIILSPEEEDEIASQLAGPGWYRAVHEILSEDGPPSLIPTNDWRYIWVRDTLRGLETALPILQKERLLEDAWVESNPEDHPLPPPAKYPLKPRPRGSEMLWRFCESLSERNTPELPHASTGPPYSLLLVEKPEASNAFSYGFGPNGGGGVVVYSGFLDEILARQPPSGVPPLQVEEPSSWWSSLVTILVGRPPLPSKPVPTPQQTADLAVLLAHELSHLVLSHHLETLSSGSIIIPGFISFAADILRTVLFPVTMLFGPFVNDAVAQLGKVGSIELVKLGEYCTSMKQELEADVVSTRILAHAGYDARHAVRFWEERINVTMPEIMGSTHPVNDIRVEKLRAELDRWETERQAALHRRASLLSPHE
ncbi:hypothetical protein ONZ45_g18930 [Pleurotus djamor]|nr:hypothetical protein ONZ45_g18930 [Pleurotus djamor]